MKRVCSMNRTNFNTGKSPVVGNEYPMPASTGLKKMSQNRLNFLLSFSFALTLWVSVGCSDKWNDHYGNNGSESNKVASPLNLYEYLKSKPEYSEFVKVLEETKVADELSRDQNLTVWAVNNEAMAKLDEQTLMTDSFIISYHINSLSIGMTKLYDGQRLPSLNGKYISVSITDTSALVSDSKIIAPDQFCKNGVVHEIDQLMIPTISIYEYLLALGDDYSIIVDSLFSKNDTIFDEANSVPIGVDLTGNTIYDSVFVIENPIFEIVDFRSEFEQITLFLPNNQVIEDCFANYTNQLTGMGKPVTYADSALAFNWIKSALFYDGIIKDYGSVTDLTSIDGKKWRTTVQLVNPDSRKMSNGLIYEVSKLKIPNNVFIKKIKSLFHYIEYVPEDQKASLITYSNQVTGGIATGDTDNKSFVGIGIPSWTYKILKVTGTLADELPIAVECSPIKIETLPDNTTLGSEMLIPPGEYKFYLGVQAKNHAFVNVYLNGEIIKSGLDVEPSNPWNYDRNTECPYPKWDGLGGLVNIITIPGTEMAHVKFKIEFNRLGKGTAEEMKIYHWAMVPTENNY